MGSGTVTASLGVVPPPGAALVLASARRPGRTAKMIGVAAAMVVPPTRLVWATRERRPGWTASTRVRACSGPAAGLVATSRVARSSLTVWKGQAKVIR